ncbi:UB2R1 enzyme, partial [Probosciger aterrimus]|nr:UB2R1 enzyme [Probosciger aterrimus]
MARPLVPSSQKALLLELKGLQEEPVEGFRVNLVDEGDLYNWEVAIFGPPNTYYEGGYFKVSGWGGNSGACGVGGDRGLKEVKLWWRGSSRWVGSRCCGLVWGSRGVSRMWMCSSQVLCNLRSCFLPLSHPPPLPALVSPSCCWQGGDVPGKQVLGTKVDAERDGVKVPTTLAEYCVKTKTPAPDEGSDLFYDDYYEDDEMEEEAESCYGDEDDSGNEES